MAENENNQIVEDTINEILGKISQKLKEEKISYSPNYNFHFEKIKFIESSEQGEIKLSYPLQQGTYQNWCEIEIHKDGSVQISGVMTSPERRIREYTDNNKFEVNLTLDEWQEPNSMDYIRSNQIGKYIPEKGILDEVSGTHIDTEYMWSKIDEKFPETCDEENIANGTNTYSWYGNGLPYVPCIEYFNEGTNLLIMTPEYATTILKKYIETETHKKEEKEIVLYKDAMTGLSMDCFDILLEDVDFYVVENEGILDQSDEEKRQKYTEYRDAVLECIDKGLEFNYNGIANDDLRKDPEFISKVEEILKRDKEQGYYEWTRDIRKQLNIRRTQIPDKSLTYSIGKTNVFKKAIQTMAKQNSDKPSDLKQITERLKDREIDENIHYNE